MTDSSDVLARLAQVVESRKGADPETSYVARLLAKGPDAFLKKVGEEAAEVVMAAKDAEHGGPREKIVAEMADLWFHGLVALAYFGLTPADVLGERYLKALPAMVPEARLVAGVQEIRTGRRWLNEGAVAIDVTDPVLSRVLVSGDHASLRKRAAEAAQQLGRQRRR